MSFETRSGGHQIVQGRALRHSREEFMTSVRECQHDHHQPFGHTTSSAKSSMEPRGEDKRLSHEAIEMIVYDSLNTLLFRGQSTLLFRPC